MSSIEQAAVGGNVLNTAAFSGPVIAAAGAPEWISQGPGPIHGGQVTGIENKPVTGAIQAIVTVPGDSNTIYIGSANGGVWKTVDGGATWKPLTDQLPSLSISELTLDLGDPTHQTLYAGTGKVSSLNGIGRAVGLLKTTDGGQNWTLIRNSEFDDNPITAIIANGDVVLVATSTFLLRSENGGLSFSKITAERGPADGQDNDGDLAFDEVLVAAVEINAPGRDYKEKDIVTVVGGAPTEPQLVAKLRVEKIGANGVVTGLSVQAVGQYSFEPSRPASVTGGAGNGLTVNLTFTPAEERLPSGKVSDLAVDPSNPSRIYLGLERNGTSAVFLSEDGGSQFFPVNTGINIDPVATRVLLSVSPAVDPVTGNHPVYAGVVKDARTTLTVAAKKGDTELTVARVDNLALNDKVNVAFSDPGFEIIDIFPSTKTILLDKPLQFDHPAGTRLFVAVKPGKSTARVDAIYRSANHGATWTAMDAPGDRDGGVNTGAQAERHFSMLADRTNPNVVFVGGDRQPRPFLIANSTGAIDFTGRLFRGDASAAPGSQWQSVTDIFADPDGPVGRTAPHADSRTMVFDNDGNILEGDDGGIFRLLNPNTLATRQWVTLNGDLRLTELHSVGYDSVNHIIVGAAQDNGTSLQNGPGDPVWTKLLGGDGGVVNVANSATESIKYISTQHIEFFRAVEGIGFGLFPGDGRDLEVNGTDFFDDVELTEDFDDTLQFYQPIILNEVDPERLLLGTSFIYEEDPDIPGFSDPGDDISLRNGKPDVSKGKKVPDPNATVGIVTALAYGGRERNSAGALIDKPDIAFVAGGKGLFVRLAKDGRFVPITSWKDDAPGGAVIRDIVLNPENWRKVYVTDSKSRVWLGELAADGTPTATWTELTGNLADLLTLGGSKNELTTIELVFDGGANLASAADDTTVLLAGGFGGVFRAINPDATSAQWAEFGTGMPNARVSDLHYDARDDILLAGTLGRGAFTIANARELLKRDSTLEITGSSSDDAIDLVRNAQSPWMVDVFLYDAGGTRPDNPAGSFQLSSFRQIVINARNGNDTVTLDSTNGPLSQLVMQGGDGTDTFNLRGPASIGSSSDSTSVQVTGIDAFGDERTQLAVFAGFEDSPGALSTLAAVGPPPDALAATRGGLGSLGDASRGLLDRALRGNDVPFLRAPSLNEAFHGDVVEPEVFFGDPTTSEGSTGTAPSAGQLAEAAGKIATDNSFVEVAQVSPTGIAQIDTGSSLFERLIQTGLGGFNLSDIGDSITSVAQLRDRLDALDDIADNVTVTEVDGVTTFDFQMVKSLVGVVDLAVDGPALLEALALDNDAIKLEGQAELGFEASVDLTFGADEEGFFLAPNATAPELTVRKVTINSDQLTASGKFGFLGVGVTDATVQFDEAVAFAFKFQEPGGAVADGKIRLPELSAAGADLLTLQVDGPGTQDLRVEATLDVAALFPGLEAAFDIADTDVILTWNDINNPDFKVELSNAPGQGANDFRNFLRLNPQQLLDQLRRAESVHGRRHGQCRHRHSPAVQRPGPARRHARRLRAEGLEPARLHPRRHQPSPHLRDRPGDGHGAGLVADRSGQELHHRPGGNPGFPEVRPQHR